MDNKLKQIQRIEHYESILDRASIRLKMLDSLIERIEEMYPEIVELKTYYESDEWKTDFADDEAGKLPPYLKRGVLSEDGIYNLLERIQELKEIQKRITERVKQ